MVNRCCIIDCRSGHRGSESGVPLFAAPKDEKLFQKWSEALSKFGNNLKRNSFVCAKHFRADAIVSEKVIRDRDGKIIFQRKLVKKILENGAVPSDFCFRTATPVPEMDSNETPCENDLAVKIVIENSVSSPIDDSKQCRVEDQLQDSIEVNSNETGQLLNQMEKENLVVFQNIYNGATKLELPDSSWGVHRCEEPMKCITFSQIQKFTDLSKAPNYVKQIVLNEELLLKLFVLNKKVMEKKTTAQTVDSALAEMCKVTVCRGGPLLRSYKNLDPKCAYKDETSDRWRHNLCSMVTQNSIICSKCSSLDKILQQHLARRKQSTKVHILMSPSRKKKIDIIRKAHRVQMQAFRRNKQRIEIMKSAVENMQKKITDISDNLSFEQTIKNLNLPQAQILLIQECTSTARHASVNGRKYTSEWLLTCLLLHIRNPATYNFLRENQILPLPCRNTIRKYLNMINLKCGFDENFFRAFKKKLQTLSAREKHGILVFDEMLVRKSLSVKASP